MGETARAGNGYKYAARVGSAVAGMKDAARALDTGSTRLGDDGRGRVGKTQGSGSTITPTTGDKEAEVIKILGEWVAILEVPARAATREDFNLILGVRSRIGGGANGEKRSGP